MTLFRTRLPVLLSLVAGFLLCLHPAAASGTREWSQYRGPDASGIGLSEGGLLDQSGTGLEVGWKRSLGSGYSSVIVSDGRVLAMFSEGDADILAAFEAETGKPIWRYRCDEKYPGHDGSHDGPLATPAVAGDRVVGLTARGRLFALAVETGAEVWTVNLLEAEEASAPYYGFGGSPLVVDDVVVLQAPYKGVALAGYELATGKRLWTAGEDRSQYQTPAVIRMDGAPVVVAAGMTNVYGIRPKDGHVLWSFPHGGGGSAYGAAGVTPVAAGDNRIFLTHKDEGATVFALGRQDDLVVPEQLWENRNIRHSYSVPVYHDGHIYAYSSRFLICVDAATGEPRWRSREPGDGFLILVDGYLVILTKDGSLHAAKASPEGYEEIAGLDLFEDHTWSPASFAGGHLYARSLGELARIDIVGSQSRATDVEVPGGDVHDTRLGRFIEAVAVTDDKSAMVDRFLAAVESFPMIEGKDRVHFLYRGDARDVAVGGDLMEVSREKPLVRIEGTDLFYYSTRLEPDTRVSYLFLVDYEQKLDPRNPRKTVMNVMADDFEFSFRGRSELEMSWLAMPDWKEPAFLGKTPRSRRGKVESREVPSEMTPAPIPVDVYLPAGYAKSTDAYPVIYVHDGPGAQQSGRWKTALDNLIGERIEPVIAVFIGAVQAPPQQYSQVFAQEIVPFVDGSFRTRPEKATRANVGGGQSGSTAFFCTFGHPELVGKLGTQSAFLFESAWNPLMQMIQPASETPMTVYLDWGTYDLRNSQENWNVGLSNRTAAEYLREKGYDPAGGEVHDGSGWPSWHLRTAAMLEALFPLSS